MTISSGLRILGLLVAVMLLGGSGPVGAEPGDVRPRGEPMQSWLCAPFENPALWMTNIERRKHEYQMAAIKNIVRKPGGPTDVYPPPSITSESTSIVVARVATNNWPWRSADGRRPQTPDGKPAPWTSGQIWDWWNRLINLDDCDVNKPGDCPKPNTMIALNDAADFQANERIRLLYLLPANPTEDIPGTRLAPNGQPVLWEDGKTPMLGVREMIEQTYLGFKFWIDELPRSNNPDGEMTFWSENHQLLFATAEHLAGQYFAGHSDPRKHDVKFRDGKTPAQHMEKVRPRLLRWLNDRLRYGLNEWNSPGYYQYDIMPLLNLVDFSRDAEIQSRAAMVLDLVVFDLARFTQNGSFGVTAGRAYQEHKVTGWEQSVGETIHILFGTRCPPLFFTGFDPNRGYGNLDGPWISNNSPAAHALASSRNYRVPTALVAIGHDRPISFIDRSRVSVNFDEAEDYGISFDAFEDGIIWWGKSAYFTKYTIDTSMDMWKAYGQLKGLHTPFMILALGQAGLKVVPPLLGLPPDPTSLKAKADALSTFTEGMALTRANLYTYRNEDVMLSSVQNFHKGQMSPQLNAWQATFDNDVLVFSTYPATGALASHDGPDWWTGNAVNPRVVQFEDAAIVAYAPDPVSLSNVLFGPRTHVWFPVKAQDWSTMPRINDSYFNLAGPGKFDQFDEKRVHQANVDGVWYFGRRGNGYIGLFSAQHDCDWTKSGTWDGKEIMCNGLRNIFIVQVGNKRKWDEGGRLDTGGAFAKFVQALTQARIYIGDAVRNPVLTLGDVHASYDIPNPQTGASRRLELPYDKQNPRLDGQPYCDDEFPRYENPYVAGNAGGKVAWGQRQYRIQLGPYKLDHDLDQGTRSGDGL
jgi:hypothetical protein